MKESATLRQVIRAALALHDKSKLPFNQTQPMIELMLWVHFAHVLIIGNLGHTP